MPHRQLSKVEIQEGQIVNESLVFFYEDPGTFGCESLFLGAMIVPGEQVPGQ